MRHRSTYRTTIALLLTLLGAGATASAQSAPEPPGPDASGKFKVKFGVDYFLQTSSRNEYPYANDRFEDSESFLWERLRPKISGSNGHVSFMFEGQDTHSRGSVFSVRTAYLDVLNAWVDVRQDPKKGWSMRVGRRQGDFDTISRLIRTPDFAAVVRSFDVAEVGWHDAKTDVRGMVIHTVDNIPKSFNTWKPGERMWSVFGKHAVGKGRVQSFLTTRYNSNLRSEGGVLGNGAIYAWELLGNTVLPGKVGVTLEHVLELGHSSTDDVRASGLFGSVTRTFGSADFEIRYIRTTGDQARGDGRRGVYDPFYPANAAYGALGLMRGPNLHAISIGASHTILKKGLLTWRLHEDHLTTLNDGWYVGQSRSTTIVRPGATSNRLGSEWDSQFSWTFSPALTVRGGFYRLFPGAYFTETGGSNKPYEFRLQIFGAF